MNDNQMRDALGDVLAEQDWWNCDPSEFADNLLPCVRRLIADELRAAAAAAHDEYSGWEAADVVRARADAIDPA